MTRATTAALVGAALVAALALGWFGGRTVGRAERPMPDPQTLDAPARTREPLYYRHPMGLDDTSPVPKKDSMGMDYVPVYAEDVAAATTAPGTVVVSAEKVQALGVRTERVRREVLAGTVRTSGTVEIDEAREIAVAPRFEGWVEQLHADRTGRHVGAGAPLATVYSPELAAAQQEAALADDAARRLAAADPAAAGAMARLRDAARTRLRNGLAASGAAGRPASGGRVVILSPADAVVLEKPIVRGARFAPGETILRLADLSQVWVVAKVPVALAGDVAPGAPARFELPAGATREGTVDAVLPVVDAASRTVDVRIAMANGDGALRPGAFGTVAIDARSSAPALTVPRSAVLDSGTRQRVFVETGPGRYAPRDVTTGRRAGDRVEVLAGLHGDEAVVVAANFLIDAESDLQSALQALAPAGAGTADPHEGH